MLQLKTDGKMEIIRKGGRTLKQYTLERKKEEQERLEQQIRFIVEIDKVKNVFRQTYLTDGKRKENDAEHSWHLAVMAVLLREHMEGEVDVA